MKRIGIVLLLITLTGLAGCASYAEALKINSMIDAYVSAVNDSDYVDVRLTTPTTGDIFVQNIKAVFTKLHYQVTWTGGDGPTTRSVMANKQQVEPGKYETVNVTANLQQDGHSVKISVQTKSNSGATASQVAKTIKDSLQQLYADKS